ncbi:Protein ViaA [Fervidicola ferrireducens]|uniref:Protein ViaA n=1 Tax=Fervidicola ferrireducens TaxID=520764 RepID=A0A140L4P7_9FIRM|nr:VWA domain-containing protein [Fervidicola ferrireducens]KXG75522.1 Protein ViaA [Fervidicola ferrireducens]
MAEGKITSLQARQKIMYQIREGVLKSTLADQMFFSDIYKASGKLQGTAQNLTTDYNLDGQSMTFDLWCSLYKTSPEFKERPPYELLLNKEILERLFAMPEYKMLRKDCMLDELMSAIGTLRLAEEIEQMMSSNTDINQGIKKVTEKLQEANTLHSLGESLMEAIGENGGDDGAWKTPQFIKTLTQLVGQNAADVITEMPGEKAAATLKKMADNLAREFEAELDTLLNQNGFDNQLKEAVQKVSSDVETLGEAIAQVRGWGNETGAEIKLDGETIARSAEYLIDLPSNRRKILEILRLAGRMSHSALPKRKAKVEIPYPEQWDGYEEGNKIERVMPQEYIAFRHPQMKRDFLKRFADKKLLQYRIDPVQYAGNGPVIVCVDESGSMEGQREIWAKAVALALFNIAMKKRRPYALIRFSASTRKPFFAHPKKKIKLDQMLSELERSTGGGTNFEKPLQKAVEIIKSNKTYQKADIVFITDGECPVAPEFLEEFLKLKAKRKVSVLSVLIGNYTSSIEKFSDVVYRTSAEKTEEGIEVLELFLEQTRKAR